jgi:drug/metabolite transporter (DMT)-like permease
MHLGIRAHLDCSSTDANIPLHGIQVIALARAGRRGAHTAQEWYKPEGRDLGLKRLLLASPHARDSGLQARERQMKRWRAEAGLVLNTLIWALHSSWEALADVSTVLFWPCVFSLATVALLILMRGAWSHPRGVWPAIRGGVLAGTFLFSGYLFQTLGLRFTTAPKSAFITGLTAVVAPLLAWCVYRNRPRAAEVAGVLLATVGMGLMTLEGSSWSIARGDLLTFFCTIGFAGHILVLGHYSKRVSLEVLSIAQIGTAAVLSLALCRWMERPVRYVRRWWPSWLRLLATAPVSRFRRGLSVPRGHQDRVDPDRRCSPDHVFCRRGETCRGRDTGRLILGGVLC